MHKRSGVCKICTKWELKRHPNKGYKFIQPSKMKQLKTFPEYLVGLIGDTMWKHLAEYNDTMAASNLGWEVLGNHYPPYERKTGSPLTAFFPPSTSQKALSFLVLALTELSSSLRTAADVAQQPSSFLCRIRITMSEP